jgi:hypothetical protein
LDELIAALPIFLAGALLTMTIGAVPPQLLGESLRVSASERLRYLMIVTMLVGGLGVGLLAGPARNNVWQFGAASGAVATLAGFWVALGGVFISERVLDSWDQAIRSRRPYANLVDHVLSIVQLLSRMPIGQLPSSSAGLISEFEQAAVTVERHLPRIVATADVRTGDWLKIRSAGIAASLRDYKMRVLIPGSQTALELHTEMRSLLVSLGNGDWNAIRSCDPDPVTRREGARRLFSFGRSIFTALMPAIVLLLVQQTDYKLTGGVANWAIVASVAWAVVSLLLLIDPQFAEKFGFVTGATTSVRGAATEDASKT